MCQRKSLYFLLFLCLFAVACTETVETPVSEPVETVAVEGSDTPPAATTALPTATATATILPSPTATLIPTETPTFTPMPAPTCPEPGTAVSFPAPANRTELQNSILEYLNAGGQWEDLFAYLDELEIKHDWIEADMNGDGVLETAVYTLLFNEEEYIPEHTWWIFRCVSNQYNIIHKMGGTWAFHSQFIVDDLDNDNRSDIIIVKGFAGSACDLEPAVWLWKDDQIIDFSPSYQELELGCASDQQVILNDLNGDNIKELIFVSDTVAHLDYAPPRGITQTFTLENTGYKLIDTEFTPPDLRVHVLDDAQNALDNGDLSLAVLLYTRAAHENMSTVGSYNIYGPEEGADSYQRAFAAFRLAIIQRVIGNVSESDTILIQLSEKYLENQPGYEFVVLTQTFFDAYQETSDLSKACLQVTKYIDEHYQNNNDPDGFRLTTHFYWGGNIAYYHSTESFCPIFDNN